MPFCGISARENRDELSAVNNALTRGMPDYRTVSMNFKRHLIIGIATCGGIGNAPFAPGTFGSLPGVLLYFLLSVLAPAYAVVCLLSIIGIAVWSAGHAEQFLIRKDPKNVVIDEIAGMGVTFIGLPFSWPVAIAGFLLFRIFDIIKPYPINFLEKRFAGGIGVVIDDVAAGVICRILLGVGLWLI